MFDRYTDVTAKLDRQLLERVEPPSHQTAREQLAKAKIKVLEGSRGIVQVNPEAILFLNEYGRPMTAWSQVRTSGALAFYCEAGMPAWPSATPD